MVRNAVRFGHGSFVLIPNASTAGVAIVSGLGDVARIATIRMVELTSVALTRITVELAT